MTHSQDSECFSILLNQLNPELDLCNETDLLDRAEHVIRNARALGANAFVRPEDIRDGNKKLILSLVAQLFNTCPKLEV